VEPWTVCVETWPMTVNLVTVPRKLALNALDDAPAAAAMAACYGGLLGGGGGDAVLSNSGPGPEVQASPPKRVFCWHSCNGRQV
jgi:hypothetical protein